MDYLGMLKDKEWVEISENFDYLRATQNFVGLRLFPFERTESLKLAVAELVEGSDVPVMAFIHALDTEARIGNRPEWKEIEYKLFLVKRKLNQGEALRKKIKDLGMSNEESRIIRAVYDDISHLISNVLTRFEVWALEFLATGRAESHENEVDLDINYHVDDKHRLVLSDWKNPDHDIIADLIKINKNAKGKIVRAFTSEKIMGYIVNNNKILEIASKQGEYPTEEFARNYILNKLKMDFVVVSGTYKTDEHETEEYNFWDDNAITFVTTRGELGKTFMASTPSQDFGTSQRTNGYVAVKQWYQDDPEGIFTKAEGYGFVCPRNVNQFYFGKLVEA